MADSEWVDVPEPARKTASAADEWVDVPSEAMGAPMAGVHGSVEAIPFGQKIVAGASAGLLKLAKAFAGKDSYIQQADDTYAGQLNRERGNLEKAEKDQKWATRGGQLLGGGLSMALMSPVKAAQGAGALMRTGAAAANAGLYGAAHGAGSADSVTGALGRGLVEGGVDAALGGVGHAVLGEWAGPAIGRRLGLTGGAEAAPAATGLVDAAEAGPPIPAPQLEPGAPAQSNVGLSAFVDELAPHRFEQTAASKRLEALGVTGQTVGHMSPRSAFGTLEEAASHQIGGEGLTAARSQAVDSWRDVGLRHVVAPGAEAPKGGSVHAQMADIYSGFNEAYGKVKGVDVYPAIHADGQGIPLQGTKNTPGAFDSIVENFPTGDAERLHAKRILDNELSRLPGKTQRPSMVEPVDVSVLQKMRENIRRASRKLARQDGKGEVAEILDLADDALGESIASQAPDLAEHLRATDAQYRQFKIMEDAVHRARSNGEFTPHDLEAAVFKATDKGGYTRGAADEGLGELARLGIDVLNPKIPVNGALPHALGAKGLRWVAPTAAHLMNTPRGRAFLLNRALAAEAEAGAPAVAPAPEAVSRLPLGVAGLLNQRRNE